MSRTLLFALAIAATGCVAESAGGSFDEENGDYYEGHSYDEGRTDAPMGFDKADLVAPYTVPPDLPELVRPEVIVSLEGLTVHLFDRATGFSRVYPTGVGALGRSGRSITPTGHFATSPDTSNRWWTIPTRWEPAYFEGYPFLRITAENSRGYNTYGLHGPITNPLVRGYVSHGCMRMEKADLIELFFLVREHASTPVTIQQETELDAAGAAIDLDTEVSLWGLEDEVAYGASVGPRDDRPVGFVGDACTTAEDCGRFGDDSYFCHEAGFCTVSCAGYCPDRDGYASTFCVEDPSEFERGVCVQRVDGRNAECALVPGTEPIERDRFVGESAAPEATARVCAAVP